jgi:hypothetical protein
VKNTLPRPPASIILPSVVLLLSAAGAAILSIVVLVYGDHPLAIAQAAGFATAAAVLGVTALMLYDGRPAGRITAALLLSLTSAVQFADAFLLGSGRPSITHGIVLPATALICLFLPTSGRYLAARQAARAAAGQPAKSTPVSGTER